MLAEFFRDPSGYNCADCTGVSIAADGFSQTPQGESICVATLSAKNDFCYSWMCKASPSHRQIAQISEAH